MKLEQQKEIEGEVADEVRVGVELPKLLALSLK